MKIAIIGAGISGLAAGNELAKAGHEIVVFDKAGKPGGRMATKIFKDHGNVAVDHGLSYMEAEGAYFRSFLEQLQVKDVVQEWEGTFARQDSNGNTEYFTPEIPRYYAPDGMKAIARDLGRMLDIRTGENVGGLTHIGEHRTKKRTWMVNFSSSNTESADAVIISTSARLAYGLINTTIDEIETLNLIREIDEVHYKPQFSFMGGYGEVKMPDWNGMHCEDDIISWISNESTKRNDAGENVLVVHTTPEFARQHTKSDRGEVEEIILDRLAQILDGWAGLPEWKDLHYWRYSQCDTMLPHSYMEIEGKGTPLALVGDYLNGNTVESAYLSGLKLGKHWAEKFPV